MTEKFLAIVNPAAGGGRCGQLAGPALDRVQNAGVELEIIYTRTVGEATSIAHSAYARGFRNFLAVGGDGTSFEILNGLFPTAAGTGPPTIAFLPLGTGNSFLRDFTTRGIEHTVEALRTRQRRACDVIRLCHTQGELHFLNLLSLGFPADVGELTNRRFKKWGELGYILGVLARLARLEHKGFAHRLDHSADWDREPCLFLTFSNSKFTGGKMMIAPKAETDDGLIEYVRWSPLGRIKLLSLFPRLFTGTHIQHSLAKRAGVRRVEFDLPDPVNLMVDGEVLRLQCLSLEILPGALQVVV